MTTDKQEIHDSYCNGYHALPRAVKRHLSLHDMQEIWHCMVKPTLEALLAELAAVTAERDKLCSILSDLKDWDCDVNGGFLSIPVGLRRRMQEAIDAARDKEATR